MHRLPLPRALRYALHRPTTPAEPPRLRIRRYRAHRWHHAAGCTTTYLPGWTWEVRGGGGEVLDSGYEPTWRQALALGGAALAVARGLA